MSQDKKLLNFGGAVSGANGVYSIEFHEDSLYGHIKRANHDGTATYFPFNAAGPTASARYENYSDSGTNTYTALQSTETTVVLDGHGPFEDKRFSPTWLSHDLYNVSTGKIQLNEVPVGTLVHVTYDLKLIPSASNEDVYIYFKFGTFNNYKMFIADSTMRNQSKTHHYSGTKTFFVINEELQQNGVELCVETTCDTQIIPLFLMIALL